MRAAAKQNLNYRRVHPGNWLTALFVSLALTSASVAQNKDSGCGIRFGVVRLDVRLPNGGISGMTKHQSGWFKKTGTKKFPRLCEDEAKPDYLILWMSEDASGCEAGRIEMKDHRYRAMVIPTNCVIGAAPLYSHLSKQEVDELRELCRKDRLEVIEEKEKNL